MIKAEISIQGDVGIVPVKAFPKGKKVQDVLTEQGILVQGLSTGHAHALNDTKKATVFRIGEDMFFEVTKTVKLVHPEHASQTFEKGRYKVLIAKEVDHIARVVQKIAD